jgi:hypothetical protein
MLIISIYPHWLSLSRPFEPAFLTEDNCFTVSDKHLYMHSLILILRQDLGAFNPC